MYAVVSFLGKQIKIEGKAVQISDEIADEYFSSRQEDSKIGTWASKQSSELIKLNPSISIIKQVISKTLSL